MITDKENKLIYDIVESFGGDQKPTLMNKIKALLARHDSEVKKRVQKVIDEV